MYKYPIHVICATFPSVGYVSLEREVVYFPDQLPLMGRCKIS